MIDREFDERVRALATAGVTQTRIAATLRCSRTRVRDAMERTNTPCAPIPHWSPAEVDRLHELFEMQLTHAEMAAEFGRRPNNVRQKCRDLGLVRKGIRSEPETPMGHVEWSDVDRAYAKAGIRYQDDDGEASMSQRYGGIRQMKVPASIHESFCGNSAAMCAGA